MSDEQPPSSLATAAVDDQQECQTVTSGKGRDNNPTGVGFHLNVAFVVSYVGTPFTGSQLQSLQHPFTTVEGVLLAALKQANLINFDILAKFKEAQQREEERKANPPKPKNKNRPENRVHMLPKHLQLGRASRTDKGVSALCNIFNITVKEHIFRQRGADSVVKELNEVIAGMTAEHKLRSASSTASENNTSTDVQPGDYESINSQVIVVQKAEQVLAGFSGRHCASRRMYRYLIPAFAIDPPRSKQYPPLPGSWVFKKKVTVGMSDADEKSVVFERVPQPDDVPDDDASSSKDFAATSTSHFRARAEKANSILSALIGHNRFHNFTGREVKQQARAEMAVFASGTLHACDNEAIRRIHRVEVLDQPLFLPVDAGVQGDDAGTSSKNTEHCYYYAPYFVFQIDGGSFLLHMIRKIVGTLIAIMRGTRESIMQDALSPDKLVTTPMAPSRYLSLTRVFFEVYEAKKGGQAVARGLTPLSASVDSVTDPMNAFEHRAIFAEMANLDATGRSLYASDADMAREVGKETLSEMRRFIRMLPMHNWMLQDNPEQFRVKVSNRQLRKDARAAAASSAEEGGGGGGGADSEGQTKQNDDGTAVGTRRQRRGDDEKKKKRTKYGDEDEDDDDLDGDDGCSSDGNESDYGDDEGADGDGDVEVEDDDDAEQQAGQEARPPAVDGAQPAAGNKPPASSSDERGRKRPLLHVVRDMKSSWLTLADIEKRNARI